MLVPCNNSQLADQLRVPTFIVEMPGMDRWSLAPNISALTLQPRRYYKKIGMRKKNAGTLLARMTKHFHLPPFSLPLLVW